MRITVLDENDNRPAFGRVYYSLEVPENQEPVTLFTLRATDLDSGDSGLVQYKIAGKRCWDRQLCVHMFTSRVLVCCVLCVFQFWIIKVIMWYVES